MNGPNHVARIAICVVTLLGGMRALAHHSFAMFDSTRHLTVAGTVRTLEWTNPHIWLWIDVPDDQRGTITYDFEGAAPGDMTRMGWTKRSVAMGDKITVQYRPLKDGRPGGSLGNVTMADGRVLGSAGSGGPGGGPPAGGATPP